MAGAINCGPAIDTALLQMFKGDTSKVGRRDWLELVLNSIPSCGWYSTILPLYFLFCKETFSVSSRWLSATS
jgi:hypothetical protein